MNRNYRINLLTLLLGLVCVVQTSYIVKMNFDDSHVKNPLKNGILDNVQILRGEVFKNKETEIKLLTFTNKHATGCSRFPKSNTFNNSKSQMKLNQKSKQIKNLQFYFKTIVIALFPLKSILLKKVELQSSY
jgi:hypothetical protein